MRRRSTYIHDVGVDVNPKSIRVSEKQILFGALKAAREERLTFGLNELPAELRQVLQYSHELHIRWAPEHNYRAVAPFWSRISPGLHVHYTPLKAQQSDLLCSLLQKLFSLELQCHSPNKTFIRPNLVSDRFASTSDLQFYSMLPSLTNLVAYIQRNICSHSDLLCIHTVSLLNIADSLDIDYDTISHVLLVKAFWSKPPAAFYDPIGELTTYNAWNIDIVAKENDTNEIGILSASPSVSEAANIQLSGFLTVLGEDDSPTPTLFSFPSRYHTLPPSQSIAQQYKVSFQDPTGLHPTVELKFPSSKDLAEPSTKPESSTCNLHTYLTLPSALFPDENVFRDIDHLFQDSHHIRSARSIAGETDLESPDYVIQKWGSTMLLELLTPPLNRSISQASTSTKPWTVTIPLHLRYLPPSPSGSQQNLQIPNPIVFWACTADEGTKFPVNPFDRVNLGFDGLFGPRTMFYFLQHQNEGGRLVNALSVPVLDVSRIPGGETAIEYGTVLVVLVGFLWCLGRLWPGLRKVLLPSADRHGQEKKMKIR